MKKVLIVDDEQDFLKILKMNLEGTGNYEVMTSCDASNIVQDVNNYNPDIILMDILMPGITGVEALEMLNCNIAGFRTPVIAVSALEKASDKLKMYKRGIVDYITKPASKEDVIRKIEKALTSKEGW
jgi:CheY-like chemotaxis protein